MEVGFKVSHTFMIPPSVSCCSTPPVCMLSCHITMTRDYISENVSHPIKRFPLWELLWSWRQLGRGLSLRWGVFIKPTPLEAQDPHGRGGKTVGGGRDGGLQGNRPDAHMNSETVTARTSPAHAQTGQNVSWEGKVDTSSTPSQEATCNWWWLGKGNWGFSSEVLMGISTAPGQAPCSGVVGAQQKRTPCSCCELLSHCMSIFCFPVGWVGKPASSCVENMIKTNCMKKTFLLFLETFKTGYPYVALQYGC